MQDQAPTTIDKYICKLAERVIFDSKEQGLSALAIAEAIKKDYSLEFDISEIKKAINRKSVNQIVRQDDGSYSLTPKAITTLSNEVDYVDVFKPYIKRFLKEYNYKYEADEVDNVASLIIDYIYYCFNSSAENLLLLLKREFNINESFECSNEEIKIVNQFIAWDNDEKNKILYDIISFSLEYCMLTTKKDSVLSNQIFKGKVFVLDTNILFRMAGINKDERQYVTKAFIQKCKEVGIKLCYTSSTLQEINRVITSQVKYISKLNYGQAPVNPQVLNGFSSNEMVNDFYVLYYNWCKNNKYDDYVSFRQYLLRIVYDAINKIDCISIKDYKIGEYHKDFNESFESLKSYKHKRRPMKLINDESVYSDINNLYYILSNRSESSNQSLWQTNNYLVSADQILSSWANVNFGGGIPLVVMPSVWLSIILRFTGRTSEDYRAFCLFLSLRRKSDEDDVNINIECLLKTLAEKTVDTSLKEQILTQIINNLSDFDLEEKDNCDTAVNKAFDNILKEHDVKSKEELQKAVAEIQEYDGGIMRRKDEEIIEAERKKDEQIIKSAQGRAYQKIRPFHNKESILLFVRWLFIGAGVLTIIFYTFNVFNIQDLISKVLKNSAFKEDNWTILVWSCNILINVIAQSIIETFKYLGSEKRKEKLFNKYLKKMRKDIETASLYET